MVSSISFLIIAVLVLASTTMTTSLPFLCPRSINPFAVNCSVLTGNYIPSSQPIPPISTLKLANLNLDRNGGIDSPRENFELILAKISSEGSLFTLSHILIVTEVARDCQIYGEYSDGPTEIAQKLGMSFVYSVEYIENYHEGDDHQCTIGNAIFSRFPLENPESLVFSSQCCMYDIRDGGRVSAKADLNLNGKYLRIYSTHLESGQNTLWSVLEGYYTRIQQSFELVKDLKMGQNRSRADYFILAGDLNAPLGDLDPVNYPLIFSGFRDSHFSLSFRDRATCPVSGLEEYGLFLFDFIWVKGDVEAKNPIVCNEAAQPECRGISDHYPIFVDLEFY